MQDVPGTTDPTGEAGPAHAGGSGGASAPGPPASGSVSSRDERRCILRPWLAGPVSAHDARVTPSITSRTGGERHLCVARAVDLRPLQDRLARLGVSSLGRAEGHVRATVAAALRACEALAGRPPEAVDTHGFADGPARLAANTAALLGPEPDGRPVRVMVTLPSSAADDGGALVRRLVAAGMDCGRVNTAHDGPDAWRRMIAHVRVAADDGHGLGRGRACRPRGRRGARRPVSRRQCRPGSGARIGRACLPIRSRRRDGLG